MVGCVKATTDRVGREGSITASGFDMKEKIGGGVCRSACAWQDGRQCGRGQNPYLSHT